jgi:hypothetical protein
VDLVRVVAVPALIQAAVDRGWWVPASSDDPPGGERPAAGGQASRDTAAADGPSLGIAPGVALQNAPGVAPEIVPAISSNAWAGLRLQARVAGPLDAMAGHRLVARALTSAAEDLPIVTAAVAGGSVIGLAISIREPQRDVRRLLALGVAPASRRRGLASAILAAHVGELDRQRELGGVEATVTRAERDVVDPLPGELRASIARRLLGAAGFRVDRAGGAIGLADRLALQATRRP